VNSSECSFGRSGQVLLLKFDKFHIVHTGHP
jgi:hypothetical protein